MILKQEWRNTMKIVSTSRRKDHNQDTIGKSHKTKPKDIQTFIDKLDDINDDE